MTDAPAPIALFVYRRLDHVQRTVEALRRNPESAQSQLIAFSDGAKDDTAQADVATVRQYLGGVTGFRSVTVVERPANFGLARSIIDGVTQVLEQHDRVIVVEDDLVTSPHFLRYMNDALREYRGDDRVISAHGYLYPVPDPMPETFFIRGADCWGWATWRRGWALFNPDGSALLAQLRDRQLTTRFNFENTYPYLGMLEAQIAGEVDSWAIRWLASAFLADKLTLYPGRSLVHNIGNDASGVHNADSRTYDVSLSTIPVRVGGVPVEESQFARDAFARFFRESRKAPPPRARIVNLLKRLLKP